MLPEFGSMRIRNKIAAPCVLAAVRAALPVLVVALLTACTYGARVVKAPPPAVSNTELGQDVPNDHLAVPAIVQCADAFHQNRPGGSDYKGPAVPECSRVR